MKSIAHFRFSQKLVLLAFLSIAAAASVSAQQFKRVIVFGDSLSDPGNYFVAFHTFLVPPFSDPVPSAPYAIGGFHFSNGPTWAEDLTQSLQQPASGAPALLGAPVFNNYAVGRARARAGAPAFSDFDLSTQVARFLADGKTGSQGDLFVIWIGSNDLADALGDPQNAGAILGEALQATLVNIQVLYAHGARSFLIVNVPDLGRTPFVRSLGAAAQAGAAQLDGIYNGLLGQYVNAVLPAALPGSQLTYLDANGLLQSVASAPASNGFTDVVDSCLTFGVTDGAFCARPDAYLFWDGIHPTAHGHRVVAQAALQALGEAAGGMQNR